MEEAGGEPYFKDLDAVLQRGHLTESDAERAEMLAHFLADIHAIKYTGKDRKILYRRRIRDLIGHGECIMGIIDAYGSVDFTTGRELVEYAAKSPWELCQAREAARDGQGVEKDLYRKAETGRLEGDLPGVSVPYEEPRVPEVLLPSDRLKPRESAKRIMNYVKSRWISVIT